MSRKAEGLKKERDATNIATICATTRTRPSNFRTQDRREGLP